MAEPKADYLADTSAAHWVASMAVRSAEPKAESLVVWLVA